MSRVGRNVSLMKDLEAGCTKIGELKESEGLLLGSEAVLVEMYHLPEIWSQ